MVSTSIASPSTHLHCFRRNHERPSRRNTRDRVFFLPRISLSQQQQIPEPEEAPNGIPRREIVLRSSELAVVGAVFNFSGKKPEYLGLQKNPPSLALCPATKNCISTAENITDLTHYAPPWYFPNSTAQFSQESNLLRSKLSPNKMSYFASNLDLLGCFAATLEQLQ